jgi:Xaa-Pro dipeptidase
LNRTTALKQSAAKQNKPQNFVIFNQTNITYFTNFPGAAALLIPEQGENVLYVSGVNYEQAKAEEPKDASVKLLNRGENLMEKIAKQAPNRKFSVDTLPVDRWRALAQAVGGEEKLELANNLILDMRKIKGKEEIESIKQACKLADIGIRAASEAIRPGVKEKDVAAEVEYAMRKSGSDGTAFETIVASGYCCAYPHGAFLEKTIREGDLVVADLGAIYKYYRSDITRTFIAGKFMEEQRKIYLTVKSAHQKAFEVIKPGVLATEADKAARQVIEEAGFGEFFVHNLGHGVGLEVHEAPILSPNSKDILTAGNIVTVEPGIYIPGFGGVRIEDTVLVTRNGVEKLTDAAYLL